MKLNSCGFEDSLKGQQSNIVTNKIEEWKAQPSPFILTVNSEKESV